MATLPPLADPSDLGAWPGVTLTEADEPRAEAVLRAASSLVRSYAGKTWADEAVPDEVTDVVVQVAARVWLNPLNVSSTTIDDFTQRLVENPDGLLHLTGSDRSILGTFRTTKRSPLWTQPTTRAENPDNTVYVPVVGTDTKFPWYDADELL